MRSKLRDAKVFEASCEWTAKRAVFLLNKLNCQTALEIHELMTIIRNTGSTIAEVFDRIGEADPKDLMSTHKYVRDGKVVRLVVFMETEVPRG